MSCAVDVVAGKLFNELCAEAEPVRPEAPLPRAPHNTAMWGRGAIRPLSLTTSVALRMFQLNYGSDGTDDGDIAADIMLLCKLF